MIPKSESWHSHQNHWKGSIWCCDSLLRNRQDCGMLIKCGVTWGHSALIQNDFYVQGHCHFRNYSTGYVMVQHGRMHGINIYDSLGFLGSILYPCGICYYKQVSLQAYGDQALLQRDIRILYSIRCLGLHSWLEHYAVQNILLEYQCHAL